MQHNECTGSTHYYVLFLFLQIVLWIKQLAFHMVIK